MAAIQALWTTWTSLRDRELPPLNAALTKAGASPVVLPPPERLVIKPLEDGEELP